MENSRKKNCEKCLSIKYFLFTHFWQILFLRIFAILAFYWIKFDAQFVHMQVCIKISHIFDQIYAF